MIGVLLPMPVMNNLQTLLLSRGIENPNQFRVATKKGDPEEKGIAPGTALEAWHNRLWVPSAPTLRMICKAFSWQPGDFLYYVPDEGDATNPINIGSLPKTLTFLDAIVIAKRLNMTLEDLAEKLSLKIEP
jgi:Cro/C1-type HTH DNA-binding domain